MLVCIMTSKLTINYLKRVKLSRYRPGEALGVPGG
jgi:hypothetical protein